MTIEALELQEAREKAETDIENGHEWTLVRADLVIALLDERDESIPDIDDCPEALPGHDDITAGIQPEGVEQ